MARMPRCAVVGNLVCLVDNREASLTEVMRELADTQY
jgi:hypothetical protein